MKEDKDKNSHKSVEDLKNRTLWDSVRCAHQGLWFAFKTEKNFAIYGMIAGFFLVLNLILRVKVSYYLAYLLAVGGVFSAELLNTAIEHVANFISDEIREEIKYVKDIAAAAVLFFGVVYFIVEFMIIGMALL